MIQHDEKRAHHTPEADAPKAGEGVAGPDDAVVVSVEECEVLLQHGLGLRRAG